MKRRDLWLWITAFCLLCAAVFSVLGRFTTVDGGVQYLTWESVSRVETDGSLTALAPDEYGMWPGVEDGGLYRFRAAVSRLPQGGYLVLETPGTAFTVRFDGEPLAAAASAYPYGGTALSDARLQIPLPSGAGEGVIEIDFQVLDPAEALYPPVARITTQRTASAAEIGYANHSALPAGAMSMMFLLVCGVILAGLCTGRADWSLLLPALAAGLLIVRGLAISSGYYFLPEGLNAVLCRRELQWPPPILLLAYLILRRRDGTLRLLGRITAGAAAALAAALVCSWLRGGHLFRYVSLLPSNLASGYYDGLLYWITAYLTLACAGISAYCFVRELAGARAEAQTLSVQHGLLVKNYQELSEKNERTAQLRHEWGHQLSALQLLQRSGDLEGLDRKLSELSDLLNRATPRTYTDHPATNVILQNTAARAEGLGVAFHASALVPGDLHIDEGDLCALLLNMLDNALEAASQVPNGEIHCRIQYTQGFLAVFCENSYDGQVRTDAAGRLRTGRNDTEAHGFGVAQMRAVAEKYHSILDISYDGQTFTVQTALKI